tara:strand:+ start:20026 stop:21768 length:1743 start_codon:yes stop_codon:yes gene_type:complete
MATIAVAASGLSTSMAAAQYASLMMFANVIDQMFVMPTLFPSDPIEGMKVGEISVMGADESTPVGFAFGQYAKLAGQVIWVHNLEEVSHTEKVGKSGKRITYTYHISCAVAICNVSRASHTDTVDGLASVDQVFADEKRVFANAATSPPASTSDNGLFCYVAGSNYYVCFTDSASINNFYNLWTAGDTISWSGWSNSTNNDSNDRILEKLTISVNTGGGGKGGSSTSSSYKAFKVSKAKTNEYGTASGTGVLEATGDTITGTGVAYSGWADDIQRSGTPTIHLGGSTSNDSKNTHMNALISDLEEKYYDTAYIVFDSLTLTDFGSRIPNFEFIVSAHANYRTVPKIIDAVMALAGLTSADFDTSEVADTTVVGYTLRGPTEASKLLQPLMLVFNIIAQERGNKIYFSDRADNVANTHSLNADYLSVHVGDEHVYQGISIQATPTNEKIGEVNFTYVNQEEDNFPTGTAKAYAGPNIAGTNLNPHELTKFQINAPLTCTPSFAKQLAHRVLFASHADDLRFEFSINAQEALKYQENDRVSFEVNNKTYKALINKVTVGVDMTATVEAGLDVTVEQDFSRWT